jgi:hypothetical protein
MTPTRRCILGVFAHPDDETSCAGGTLSRYAQAGVDVYVATATRGEAGHAGNERSGGDARTCPVRGRSCALCSTCAGAKPSIILGYRDQAVSHANADELIAKIVAVMDAVTPMWCSPLGRWGLRVILTTWRCTAPRWQRFPATATAPPLNRACTIRPCPPRPCRPWA